MNIHMHLRPAADDTHEIYYTLTVLGYQSTKMKLATYFQRPSAGMIRDTPSGRTLLHHLQQFFEDQDMEMQVGESVPVSTFADHNVGRVLDRISEKDGSRTIAERTWHLLAVYVDSLGLEDTEVLFGQ